MSSPNRSRVVENLRRFAALVNSGARVSFDPVLDPVREYIWQMTDKEQKRVAADLCTHLYFLQRKHSENRDEVKEEIARAAERLAAVIEAVRPNEPDCANQD